MRSIQGCYTRTRHISQPAAENIKLREKISLTKGGELGAGQGRRDDIQRNKMSRPETMFSRSVETRLFIFPTKLLETLGSSPSSSPLSDSGGSSFRLPLILVAVVADCSLRVSWLLPPAPPDRILISTTEPLSGVAASLRSSGVTVGVGAGEDEVSAFTRMRKACSKTSCVTMAVTRMRVPA